MFISQLPQPSSLSRSITRFFSPRTYFVVIIAVKTRILKVVLRVTRSCVSSIGRQLEDELQAKDKDWKSQRDDWRTEIDRLQDEIQRQQKLLSVNLSKSPQTQTEAYMQHEITRLTSENLVSGVAQKLYVMV